MGKEWDNFKPDFIEHQLAAAYRKTTHTDRSLTGQTAAGWQAGRYDRSVEANRGFQAWCALWLTECFRVMKPGATLFAFGGTRTFHRLACAMEDAGFEDRETLAWLYGSGFPKAQGLNLEGWDGWKVGGIKPAWEPILWGRKPCEGSTMANVLKYGVGAFNADAGRVGLEGGTQRSHQAEYPKKANGKEDRSQHWARVGHSIDEIPAGRFPPNLLLDDEAAAMLDEMSGESKSGVIKPYTENPLNPSSFNFAGREKPAFDYGDTGGASRFFPRFSYTAKATRWEREAGLGGFEEREVLIGAAGHKINPTTGKPVVDIPRSNPHPTVKPIRLMRWLIELVTREGQVILDPLCGSGTTNCAALWCGRETIGIEKETEYHAIAEARLAWWRKQAGKDYEACQRQWDAESGDTPLFGAESATIGTKKATKEELS